MDLTIENLTFRDWALPTAGQTNAIAQADTLTLHLTNTNIHNNILNTVNNKSHAGGTLGAVYALTLTGENASFTANKYHRGSALASNNAQVTISGTNYFGTTAYNESLADDDPNKITGVASLTSDATTSLGNAGVWGGAVFGHDGFQITGTNVFKYNYASLLGGALSDWNANGAVYQTSSSSHISGNNIFANNVADASGGAIFSQNDITLSGSNTFENNVATTGFGGAIMARQSFNIEGGTQIFRNNTAGEANGGAIHVRLGNAVFSGDDTQVIFEGNTAKGVSNDLTFGETSGTFLTFVQNGSNGHFYAEEPLLTIKDGGNYHFGGGIVTALGGNIQLGTENDTNSPTITFGENSISDIKYNAQYLDGKSGTTNIVGANVTFQGNTDGTSGAQFSTNDLNISGATVTLEHGATTTVVNQTTVSNSTLIVNGTLKTNSFAVDSNSAIGGDNTVILTGSDKNLVIPYNAVISPAGPASILHIGNQNENTNLVLEGTYNFDLSGKTNSDTKTGYDQIIVNGATTIDTETTETATTANLEITLNGYSPVVGDYFDIITSSEGITFTGHENPTSQDLNTILLNSIAQNYFSLSMYDDQTLRLSVIQNGYVNAIPEPTSLVLLLFGIFGLYYLKRHNSH